MISRLLVFLLIFPVAGISGALADQRLDILKSISAAGAPGLTLKMLDQAQPGVDEDLYEWILWEQERYKILSRWEQWDQLLIKLENLPVDIPDQFRNQTIIYKSRAYIQLGQTATARKILREQVWKTAADFVSEYQTWRRLIIESYLHDDRIEDARIAMLRFNQDFKSEDEAWLQLWATVLIKTGRYQQAIEVLKDFSSWQSRYITLLGKYLAEDITASDLWLIVKKELENREASAEQLATLWALAFYASEKMSPVDRVVALEQYFKSSVATPIPLFDIEVDRLWQAYADYAELVGNRSELLIGDDRHWLELAQNTAADTPVKARSLYALLMEKAEDSEVINLAADGFLKTFSEIGESEKNILNQLFNHSDAFKDASRIPPIMRYQLVDLALKNSNIVEATRLMSGLTTHPEGTDRMSWQLRQSRVLILGGRYEEGNQIMQTLISEYSEPDAENTDKILQVLFDMQTVNLDEEVIQHLNRLLALGVEPRQHREILFWIGDSYKSLQRYDQAALLYLQSAMLPDPEAMDPWAQTARFNAADSLQQAGLIDDARRVYEALLNITQEPARRSLLKHNIQQLWLNQSAE
jgi:hypothetical protein